MRPAAAEAAVAAAQCGTAAAVVAAAAGAAVVRQAAAEAAVVRPAAVAVGAVEVAARGSRRCWAVGAVEEPAHRRCLRSLRLP